MADTEKTPEQAPAAAPVPTPPPAEEVDWKAQARKWEARAKESRDAAKVNEDAAKRLSEIEEAAKSAEQKQAEALQAATEKLAQYERADQVRTWVDEVATAADLSPAQKAALKGSSKEELEAHATVIKSLSTPAVTEPAPYVVPTLGTTPPPSGNIPIGQQIAAAEKAGQADLVAQLKAIQLGAMSAS